MAEVRMPKRCHLLVSLGSKCLREEDSMVHNPNSYGFDHEFVPFVSEQSKKAEDPLIEEATNLVAAINRQIEIVKVAASRVGYSAFEMRNADGSWVLPELLAAKAQTIHAIALLKEKN